MAEDLQTINSFQALTARVQELEDIVHMHTHSGSDRTQKIGRTLEKFERLADFDVITAQNSVTFSDLPPRRFLIIRIFIVSKAGSDITALQFNGDTANNYTYRYSTDFTATAGTTTNAVQLMAAKAASPEWFEITIKNEKTRDKRLFWNGNSSDVDVSAADNIVLGVGSWYNTADYINKIKIYTTSSNNYSVGTRFAVYGKQELEK